MRKTTKKKVARRRTPKVTRTDFRTAPTARESRVMNARHRLWSAIDCYKVAFGEAQWLDGYRARRGALDDAEGARLFQKEMAQFAASDAAAARVTRAMDAFARAVKAAK